MKYKVFYPTAFEKIDHLNDNIDVCVTIDKQTYTLVFITPENLKWLMDKDNDDYIHPNFKFIVVKSLKKEYIEKAVRDIVNDKKLLELYGL